MSPVRALALLACVGAALVLAPARAEVQRLACDGTVYRVEVDTWVQSGRPSGTVLRSTRQRPKGGKDLSYIPGTDDAAIDRDPALEIDPSSGKPVVVWARSDAGAFNLYVSRFDTSWSAPRLLVKMDGDDLEPQVRFDARYLHVSWRQDRAGQTTYWRSSFLSSTLEPAFGPERIPTEDAVSVSTDGGLADATEAPAGTQYFCATLFDRVGDPGRAYVWGVRDEPVPINYRQSFVLPPEVRSVTFAEAGHVGGRFTYWFTTNDRMYYTTLANGRWVDMRVVELTAQTSVAEARLQLAVLNQRLTAGGR
jgi:hypothetical protein